jgi:hypothetical protein
LDGGDRKPLAKKHLDQFPEESTMPDLNEVLRQRIRTLINTRKGENYSTISALLGRNASYMHQYITRGSPKCLREEDRRQIARYFGIAASHLFLTDPDNSPPLVAQTRNESNIVMIDIWPAGKSEDALPFRLDWLKNSFTSSRLIAVKVESDAMEPSLKSGSIALVDCSYRTAQHDGIYIILSGGKAMARRLSLNPLTGQAIIGTDNSLYANQTDCDLKSLSILGRVVWVGQCM